MSIIGGFDLHRKQITFDYVDTVTGEVQRGQVAPADRLHLAGWLRRFDGCADAAFAVEGCTGWRYVVEELAKAGVVPHLAEPADTAEARGKKRRAKTDRADSRHIRGLLEDDRIPECYIPPSQVLEYRALLELYHDLHTEHTAWIQRIHAVLFHQGAQPVPVGTAEGRQQLEAVAASQLSAAGQTQVATAMRVLAANEVELDQTRRQLTHIARHLRGAKTLTDDIYGVGPVTGLALTCWLAGDHRFSSARKAVRFAGLDVTVYSSAGKRSPGHLSRQGPPVLRWAVYEAGKANSQRTSPDRDYYTSVKDRIDGKRAALSQARRIIRRATHILTDLGDDAFTPV